MFYENLIVCFLFFLHLVTLVGRSESDRPKTSVVLPSQKTNPILSFGVVLGLS